MCRCNGGFLNEFPTQFDLTKINENLQLSERMVVSLYVTINRRMRSDGRKLVFSHPRHHVRMSLIVVLDFFLITVNGNGIEIIDAITSDSFIFEWYRNQGLIFGRLPKECSNLPFS